jgi:hypothetical protein
MYQTEALNGVLAAKGGRMTQQATKVRIRFEVTSDDYLKALYETLGSLTRASASVVNRKPDSRTGNIYKSYRLVKQYYQNRNHFMIDLLLIKSELSLLILLMDLQL